MAVAVDMLKISEVVYVLDEKLPRGVPEIRTPWREKVIMRQTRLMEGGTETSDYTYGAAIDRDGSYVLAAKTFGDWNITNRGEADFAIVKLDNNGSLLWKWQNGTSREDYLNGVAIAQDGSIVVEGGTNGSYHRENEGGLDFVAMKLDSNGSVQWAWQNGTDEEDSWMAVAMGGDGSVVLAGYTCGNWITTQVGACDVAVAKLDLNGTLLWTWQSGTENGDYARSAVVAEDGSVFVVIETNGHWGGSLRVGADDFAAVKLDANGTEIWRWQGGTIDEDYALAAVATTNGTFVLAGTTRGDWGGPNAGDVDFAALKLDADGNVIWKWQGGTSGKDEFKGAAALEGGSTILVGYTSGSWEGENAGVGNTSDFAAVILNADGTVKWRWQDGTVEDDEMRATATDGNARVFMAGIAERWWTDGFVANVDFAAIVLDIETTVNSTMSPTASRPTRVSFPFPTTSSSTHFPSSSPATASPAHLHIPSTTMRPTDPPTARSDQTSPPEAVIAGAVAGVAVIVLVMALVVCYRRRAGRRKLEKHLQPQPFQATNIPPPAGGTSSPRPSRDCTDVKALPGQHAKEVKGLSPNTSDRKDGREPARVKTQGLITRPTHLTTATSMAATPSVCVEVGTETSPMYDPRANPAPEGANPAHATDMSSENHASTVCARESSRSRRLSMAEAVMGAAEAVANSSSVPGVSEAATLISTLVKLVVERQNSDSAAEWRLRWCRSIVTLLDQASKILGKGEDEAIGDAERSLLEDVQDSVSNLVDIIRIYESKNNISKLFVSLLFKSRQEEAEAIMKDAVLRLQIEARYKLTAVGQDVQEGFKNLQKFESDSASQAMAELRRAKRQRRLQQLEIPEDQVTLTDVLLGKGGFADVFLADYSGINAAAKVIQIDNEQPSSNGQGGVVADAEYGTSFTDEQSRKRRLFKRELEAMTRLKSSHTVHVYGAITSRGDHFVLVMELMTGGDLRTLLRQADAPLPQDRVHGIMRDICFGMAFLHSKGAIHGDVKPANVLFDGSGTAKIADFGTAKWIQHGASTGLVSTYVGTKATNSAQMSIPWAAPEILDNDEASFESDVYSFGIVSWEIASRQMPWAGVNARSIFRRVVLTGDRPEMPNDVSADIEVIIRSCWREDPTARPTFSDILGTMKSLTA